MTYKYSNQNYNKEHMARAAGRALPISTKVSIEICNTIRKKSVARAKIILKEAINLKKPIEFTRFTNGAGHKKGISAGKYPQKAANEILKLIETLEANAQFKGLNTSNLIITHIMAHNAGNVWRYGRHRRRKMKRTNIEITVEESKTKKKEDPKLQKDEKKVLAKEKEIKEQKEEIKGEKTEGKTPKQEIKKEEEFIKKEEKELKKEEKKVEIKEQAQQVQGEKIEGKTLKKQVKEEEKFIGKEKKKLDKEGKE